MKRQLQVMKFGGTSVGDAKCISRVADIVQAAAKKYTVVVVVSAMARVTNTLIEAANRSEAGERDYAIDLLEKLRIQHEAALSELIKNPATREKLSARIQEILGEAKRLCEGTALLRQLTPRTLDTVSSLGERLTTPIVAGVLSERGLESEGIEATELIITDSHHGGAEPLEDRTQERCEVRLRPLLDRGGVPVVTGFIGATAEGVLTTLGRGGSDYSGTILGAAIGADEVIIWTDVNGVLTADPRMVPNAHTIPEISYREAAELAYFGAKVLHPKTLRAVARAGIPVWIRNSFQPDHPGTKITPDGQEGPRGVKALTAISDVALIAIGGPGIIGLPDVVGRTFSTTAAIRVPVLLISQSSSQNDICFVVSSADGKRTVEALRAQFAQDLMHQKVDHITIDSNISIVAVVGENMRGTVGIAGRTFNVLGRENVNVIAIAQGSSETNISFAVARSDMKKALIAVHDEFALDSRETRETTPVAQ
jgi:bifunctional aspartokinase / homoserine dehydrogenase 1